MGGGEGVSGQGGDTCRPAAQPSTQERGRSSRDSAESARCLSPPAPRSFSAPWRAEPRPEAHFGRAPRALRARPLPDLDLRGGGSPPRRTAASRPATRVRRGPAAACTCSGRGRGWRPPGSGACLPSLPRPLPGVRRYLPCVSQSESQSQTLGGTRAKERAPKGWRRERGKASSPWRCWPQWAGARRATVRIRWRRRRRRRGTEPSCKTQTWRLRGAK